MTHHRIRTLYFHGTSTANINNFKLRVTGVGECSTPVSGIWLASEHAGARWHATTKIKNITYGYVYKVTIHNDAVLADTLESALPVQAYNAYKKQLSLFERIFSKNTNWYSRLRKKVINRSKHVELSSDEIREGIIKICTSIGVDGILRPVVSVYPYGACGDMNEGKYGTTLLLINTEKVKDIFLIGEIQVI